MNIYKIQAITIWNFLSSNYLLSGQNKKGSIFTVKVLFLDPRQFSESATRDTRQLYTLSLFTSPEKCFRKKKKRAFCSRRCHTVEFFLSLLQHVNDYHAL